MFGVAPSSRWRSGSVAGAAALVVACSIAERRVEERDTGSGGGATSRGGASSVATTPSAGRGGALQVAPAGGSGGSAGGEVLPARACASSERFGMPRRVLGLSEAGFSDGKVWLSPDEGTAYFLSTRGGGSVGKRVRRTLKP